MPRVNFKLSDDNGVYCLHLKNDKFLVVAVQKKTGGGIGGISQTYK